MTVTRRQALVQVAAILGGALSAPTLAGALDQATRRRWVRAQGWSPRTLSAAQVELVATIADHIIPETDTPGARAAGVHRFVDVLLSDHYGSAERDRFLAGLTAVDAAAQAAHGQAFAACAPADRVAALAALDALAYGQQPGESGWFFRRMKELTLTGYYTSEIGAEQELRLQPLHTEYKGDIHYNSVGRSWS